MPKKQQSQDKQPVRVSKQIKTKQRVADHGEVYTADREVNAMLDLVKWETERIDSRFLEPACGDGNFLAEILKRKLSIVKKKYRRCPLDFEKNAVLAAGSIYGIDILQDNAENCRRRMFDIWDAEYKAVCKKECSDDTRESVRLIFNRNIVCGNALTLMCVDENQQDTDVPIVFSEWAFVTGSMTQRKDYTFAELVNGTGDKTSRKKKKHDGQLSLFEDNDKPDEEGRFLQQYIVHYKHLADAESE